MFKNKKKIIVGICISCFILFCIIIYYILIYKGEHTNNTLKEGKVIAQNGEIIEGEMIWVAFLNNTHKGNEDSIVVSVLNYDKQYNALIEYDKEQYKYYKYDANGEKALLYTNKYLLDLKRGDPVSNGESSWIILTDKFYTFDEIMYSTYSNNSKDFIAYNFLFADE